MSDTAISAAPIVSALAPFVVSAVATVVGASLTLAAAEFRKWTGVQIQQSFVDAVRKAAEDEAGKAVAAAADNLAAAQIDVGSHLTYLAAEAVMTRIPGAVKASGITPDELDGMIVAEIGRLQARMTSVPPNADAH